MMILRRYLAVLVLLLSACAGPTGPTGLNGAREPQDALATLWVVIPETGGLSAFGRQIRTGVEAAVSAANEGRPAHAQVRAEFLDDACEPGKATEIARQLVQKKARIVIGHVCSGASLPASSLYAQGDVLMLTPASSNVALTERGLHNVFRLALRSDVYGQAAAELIANRYAGKRLMIVHEDEVSGRGHAEQMQRLLRERGITPAGVLVIGAPAQAPALAERLVAEQADVVFYGGHHPDQLGALLKAARNKGYKGQFVSNDGASNEKLWPESAGAAEGLLFAFAADYRKLAEAADAVRRIRARGFEPEGFTMNAYAATQISVKALSAGQRTPADLFNYVRTQPFQTDIGTIRFNAQGDVQQPRVGIYRWNAGKTHEVAERAALR